jgi:hypothetical protein
MIPLTLDFKSKNDKQLLAAKYWIDNTTEQILYGGAKGGGKSYLGAVLIFADALIYPDTHYFIARKELNDLRKFTVPTIHEVFKNWGLKIEDFAQFNGQDNAFTLYNGSKVFLIACSEVPSDPLYERFGSMQMTRGWIEEGGEVPDNAKSNLWLSIGRWKNEEYKLKKKLLITANPKKGWMKKDFVDPSKGGTLTEDKKYIQAFATDNVYLPEDYLNTLRGEKNLVRRQRLWEGSWDYDEDMDSLVSYNALTDAFSNTITKDGQRYITVDVARMGNDSTVVTMWEGLELKKIDRFSKQAINVTVQKIKDLAAESKTPYSNIIIDEDGIGGGVVDNLFGVRGFVANSTALPTATEIRGKQARLVNDYVPKINFRNLKAQCAFKLAELINEHKIAFRVEEYRDVIIEELTSLLRQKDIDSDGKLAIKPKDEIKEELGKSPDIGDAIIFRIWFELQKTASFGNSRTPEVVLHQENNFERNRMTFINSSNK